MIPQSILSKLAPGCNDRAQLNLKHARNAALLSHERNAVRYTDQSARSVGGKVARLRTYEEIMAERGNAS